MVGYGHSESSGKDARSLAFQLAAGGADGFKHRVIIVQGLSYAHQNNIPDLGALRQGALQNRGLARDLRGLKVSFEAALADQAEPASHAATSLCGDADRPVVFARNQDAFDKGFIERSNEYSKFC